MELEQMTVADLGRLLAEANRDVEAAKKRRDALQQVAEAIRAARPYLAGASGGDEDRNISLEEGRRSLGFGGSVDEPGLRNRSW
jgi:hypothetical protein